MKKPNWLWTITENQENIVLDQEWTNRFEWFNQQKEDDANDDDNDDPWIIVTLE